MTVGIGPGAQSGVAGSGLGVGVVVVAIFKIGAFVEEEAEAAPFEIGTIAVEVVSAKLIDHEDDDQMGPPVVGAGPSQWGPGDNEESEEQRADTTLGGRHVAPTSIAKHVSHEGKESGSEPGLAMLIREKAVVGPMELGHPSCSRRFGVKGESGAPASFILGYASESSLPPPDCVACWPCRGSDYGQFSG